MEDFEEFGPLTKTVKRSRSQDVIKRIQNNLIRKLATAQKEKKRFSETNFVNMPIFGDIWSIFNIFCTQLSSGNDDIGTGLQQGVASDQRTGSKIRLKEIHVNVLVQPDLGNTPDTGLTIRFLIVRDKQVNKAYPNTLNIMNDSYILSHRSNIGIDRFDIVKDVSINWNWQTQIVAGSAQSVGPQRILSFNIATDETISYQGSSGETNDIIDTAYYLMAIDNTGSATQRSAITMMSQIVYTDS